MLICLFSTATFGDDTDQNLAIADGGDWHFLTGQDMPVDWTQDDKGVIDPLAEHGYQPKRAFYTKRAYSDLIAQFEYNPKYDFQGSGHAGMILRAQDPNHFYLVYFPWTGQTLRAKNFLVAVGKVEGDGYIRNLKLEWVPNVPSETDRWYKVRVEAAGPNIEVWVDGRRALAVIDETYKAGLIGLAGQGRFLFRNLKIAGNSYAAASWNRKATIPEHSFTVGLSGAMPSGCVAPNGNVLLAAGNQLVRSTDKGRTWSELQTLPEFLGEVGDYSNTMFRTSNNRLMVMVIQSKPGDAERRPQILISDSKDNGHTWSQPVLSQVSGDWSDRPDHTTPYGPLVETQDGTLIRFFLYAEPSVIRSRIDGRNVNIYSWGANSYKAFAIRSTDGGQTWSGPIEIDDPSAVLDPRGTISGSMDFTEPTGVAIGNQVMVTVRPVYSPYMWQCWSKDSGEHWDAASRTTFPGYAQSMIRLKSGPIICAHRAPHYSINISRDDGLNWDAGTIIDYRIWAMGCLVEVSPNIVLCTYMGNSRKEPLRVQLIRVTPKTIRPIAVDDDD